MNKGRTEREAWLALQQFDDDLLDMDCPPEEIEAILGAAGVDSSALGDRMVQHVAEVRERKRLAWQRSAAEKKARLEFRSVVTAIPAGLTKAELLARLDELRGRNAKGAALVTLAAHKRKPEESTEDELRTLLEEMERALALSQGND